MGKRIKKPVAGIQNGTLLTIVSGPSVLLDACF
jgi:hypothetical protein